MPDRPNILLIQADQWRGDCLSADGHPVVYTPFLDRLAADGARFTRAYSATPVCIPARVALHTGLAPQSHGRVAYRDGVPWEYPLTLAGEFARHGYQTRAIGKLHTFPERQRLGFEQVELHDGYLHASRDRRAGDLAANDDYLAWLRRETGRADADFCAHGLNCNAVAARPWDQDERLHPTNWAVTRALAFLAERDHRRPFFLYVSFRCPHPPYDPPAWAFDQYLRMDLPVPPVGDWAEDFAEFDQSWHPEAFRARYRPDVALRARAGYYGHLTHLDQQINRLLETLAEWRLDGATAVCFTSDHGEMLGDHHLYRKGLGYEGSARVPLLLRAPGVPPLTVSDAVAEQRDIMPTLLACAGLPVPAGLDGHSLLAQARGAAGGVREQLHGELTMLGQSCQWLTDGREKYLWFSRAGREQLFDLRTDPHECRDLARVPASTARLAWWRTRLAEELAGRAEGFAQDGRLHPGCPPREQISLPCSN
ncbi:MAG: arylsulfatase [Verrucomicrobiales bacterium]|nr:arylsulfatase [Verrucomicrobiales bacterium]